MRKKILNYMANGLAASQVATLVGCSPSYISQLMKDDAFKDELRVAILNNPASVDDKLEDKYSAVEHSLISAVQDAIPGAELPAITRALDTVARIRHDRYKMKNPAVAGGQQNNLTFVQITMPAHILRNAPVMQLNERSEIIAIDGKPMAPLSSDGVKSLFENIKARKAEAQVEYAIPRGAEI